MSEHDHSGVTLRTRMLYATLSDDDAETPVTVEHVYLPEGAAGPCGDCGQPAHDPGVVGLTVGEETAFLDAGEALVIASRLTRAANLILESGEEPADLEREAARLGAPAQEGPHAR